ncbi:hypothetical protein FACS1894166_11550 [Bacilli bacterium]|nr:hypothetical protein FACS1894166_11550 [Bacilli bacterium]
MVPVTSTYFNFNGTTDTISGFSTAVIADYSDTGSKTMLNNFNTINFNNSPVKYMAGNASFGNPDADTHNSVFDT